MSLSRAQNMFMPTNINSVVLLKQLQETYYRKHIPCFHRSEICAEVWENKNSRGKQKPLASFSTTFFDINHSFNSIMKLCVSIKCQYKSTSALSECRSIVGYDTHYLLCCSLAVLLTKLPLLLCVFEVSVRRISIKFCATCRFILKPIRLFAFDSVCDS